MNCTHVFAYEMSLAALFPDLERTMRETELFHQLHPTGYLPHRVTLPLYLPRSWERPIGGPEKPALDGLLSLVLKTYRESKRNPDPQWLTRAWLKFKQAMQQVMTVHDAEGDGVIKGEQPNTYDISIFGPNTFIGTLYLAALRASEEMAQLQDESELAAQYRERFEKGRTGYDDLLWNGEYYIQIYDSETNPEQNYGKGCHSDHLFGQWWAHVLGLGHVLDGERVRQAVQSIVRYNFRANFTGHKQQPRVYACDDDPGLLICSWPQGGRPPVPTLYSDEIWTGIEYEVAALCLYEGMREEGLAILRAVRQRYNGTRRSPWNDVECGDHYIRALSSWALLDAACGYHYDAATNALTIQPLFKDDSFRAFCITATGWGTASITRIEQTLSAQVSTAWGTMLLASLTLPATDEASITAHMNGSAVECAILLNEEGTHLQFADVVVIPAGQTLMVELTW